MTRLAKQDLPATAETMLPLQSGCNWIGSHRQRRRRQHVDADARARTAPQPARARQTTTTTIIGNHHDGTQVRCRCCFQDLTTDHHHHHRHQHAGVGSLSPASRTTGAWHIPLRIWATILSTESPAGSGSGSTPWTSSMPDRARGQGFHVLSRRRSSSRSTPFTRGWPISPRSSTASVSIVEVSPGPVYEPGR